MSKTAVRATLESGRSPALHSDARPVPFVQASAPGWWVC